MLNAARWSGIARLNDRLEPATISTTSGSTSSGMNRSANDCQAAERALNATTNVSR